MIDEVESHLHLGVTLQSNLSWKSHIVRISNKACNRLDLLKSLKYKLNRSTLACLYKCLVRPLLEYADAIWDNCTKAECQILEHVQYEAARVVTGAIKGTSSLLLREELAWDELSSRRKVRKLEHFYKIVSNLTPNYLLELLPVTVSKRSNLSLRSNHNFCLFSCRTERFQQSFFPSTIRLWNSLDLESRNVTSLQTFKGKLRVKFFLPKYNKLFNCSLSRKASILHTRLKGHCHRATGGLGRVSNLKKLAKFFKFPER